MFLTRFKKSLILSKTINFIEMYVKAIFKRIYIKLWLDLPLKIIIGIKSRKLTKNQLEFKKLMIFFKSNVNSNSNGIVLVQQVRNYEYSIKMFALAKVVSDKNQFEINTYLPYVDKVHFWFFTKKDWVARKLINIFFKEQYIKINNSVTKNVIHSNHKKHSDIIKVNENVKKLLDTININNLDSINYLELEGIKIGDLIYDNYLRFFHKPTITEIDNKLILVIDCAVNIFYNFKDLINKYPIKVIINSYSSYLDHGIAARVCLYNDIDVYTIGSYSYTAQKMTKDFLSHHINHTLFNPNLVLNGKQRELAKNKLESRFDGKIDPAARYLRQTSFANTSINLKTEELFKLRPRNIVIYAHDFYDSPHINRKLAFADLFQFLKQTLNSLINISGTTVFIKIHPNGIVGNEQQTIELVNSFEMEHFIILDATVSNNHIIAVRPDLIATARGTVCLEMAYFEIPSVALFDNIFSNFSFTHTCQTIDEYFNILKGKKQVELNYCKEKIFSFYYQAYLEKRPEKNTELYDWLASCEYETFSNEYLSCILNRKEEVFSSKILDIYSKVNNN